MCKERTIEERHGGGIITRSLTHAHLLLVRTRTKDRRGLYWCDWTQRDRVRVAPCSCLLSGSFFLYLPELISDNVEFNSDHRTVPLRLVLRRVALQGHLIKFTVTDKPWTWISRIRLLCSRQRHRLGRHRRPRFNSASESSANQQFSVRCSSSTPGSPL